MNNFLVRKSDNCQAKHVYRSFEEKFKNKLDN